MAGTDRSRSAGAHVLGAAPVVVLIEPQLGENIGFVARAMMNAGLAELRIVNPRDGWPNDRAVAASSGADAVLDAARLYASAAAAVADLNRVLATTARPRHELKPVLTPRLAVAQMRAAIAGGGRVGILFGAERTGLLNEHVMLADTILTIPLAPGFSSLNLGQAVMIFAYEWFLATDETPERQLPPSRWPRAVKAELHALFAHLEAELARCGFLYDPAKRPAMVRNMQAMFERAELTQQEVRTLRGMLVALAEGRRRPGARAPEVEDGAQPDEKKSAED